MKLSEDDRPVEARGMHPQYPRQTGFLSVQTGFLYTHPQLRNWIRTHPKHFVIIIN